jgi:hypothetical protein
MNRRRSPSGSFQLHRGPPRRRPPLPDRNRAPASFPSSRIESSRGSAARRALPRAHAPRMRRPRRGSVHRSGSRRPSRPRGKPLPSHHSWRVSRISRTALMVSILEIRACPALQLQLRSLTLRPPPLRPAAPRLRCARRLPRSSRAPPRIRAGRARGATARARCTRRKRLAPVLEIGDRERSARAMVPGSAPSRFPSLLECFAHRCSARWSMRWQSSASNGVPEMGSVTLRTPSRPRLAFERHGENVPVR